MPILAKADVEDVIGELPPETVERLRPVLDALEYDRLVLDHDDPPFELNAADVDLIHAAVVRLPGTEQDRRESRAEGGEG